MEQSARPHISCKVLSRLYLLPLLSILSVGLRDRPPASSASSYEPSASTGDGLRPVRHPTLPANPLQVPSQFPAQSYMRLRALSRSIVGSNLHRTIHPISAPIDLPRFVRSSSVVFFLLRPICHDTHSTVICPSTDFLSTFSFRFSTSKLLSSESRPPPPQMACEDPSCFFSQRCSHHYDPFLGFVSRNPLYLHPDHRTRVKLVSQTFAVRINIDVLHSRGSANVRDSGPASGNACFE